MRCAMCGAPVPERDRVVARGMVTCYPCHRQQEKWGSRAFLLICLVFFPIFAAAVGFIAWVFWQITQRHAG